MRQILLFGGKILFDKDLPWPQEKRNTAEKYERLSGRVNNAIFRGDVYLQ